MHAEMLPGTKTNASGSTLPRISVVKCLRDTFTWWSVTFLSLRQILLHRSDQSKRPPVHGKTLLAIYHGLWVTNTTQNALQH